MKKVGLVDDNASIRGVVKGMLEDSEYTIVFESADALGVVDLCMEKKPDILILDVKLPSKDGIDLAEEINAISPIPIVLITGSRDDETIKRALYGGTGVMAYVGKPFDRADIMSALGLAILRKEELDSLKKENLELKGSLENRRIIEKAKGLLMEKRGISEEEAFAFIRTRSMNERNSMKDVAQAVVKELG